MLHNAMKKISIIFCSLFILRSKDLFYARPIYLQYVLQFIVVQLNDEFLSLNTNNLARVTHSTGTI